MNFVKFSLIYKRICSNNRLFMNIQSFQDLRRDFAVNQNIEHSCAIPTFSCRDVSKSP